MRQCAVCFLFLPALRTNIKFQIVQTLDRFRMFLKRFLARPDAELDPISFHHFNNDTLGGFVSFDKFLKIPDTNLL
jgi:hypothetical protein